MKAKKSGFYPRKENLIDSESDCYVNEDEIGFPRIEFILPFNLSPISPFYAIRNGNQR